MIGLFVVKWYMVLVTGVAAEKLIRGQMPASESCGLVSQDLLMVTNG